MPFVIDDIAAAAATEISAEAAEAISEEVASEFGEAAFENSLEDVHHLPEVDDGTKLSEVEHQGSHIESSIEQEFAPENFNVEGSETFEQHSPEPTTIERTSTFEEQTIDNFELESQRTEIESKMTLGQEHDGGTLRYNMEQVMEKKSNTEISNAHHIVGRDTPQAAKKLEELSIDRNDPANGIFLPNSTESPLKGAVHGQGRHSIDYSNEVEQRFAGVTTREEALEVLQSIKEDLYSGDLYVHKDIPANK